MQTMNDPEFIGWISVAQNLSNVECPHTTSSSFSYSGMGNSFNFSDVLLHTVLREWFNQRVYSSSQNCLDVTILYLIVAWCGELSTANFVSASTKWATEIYIEWKSKKKAKSFIGSSSSTEHMLWAMHIKLMTRSMQLIPCLSASLSGQ